jgi:hypothetical protein
MPCPEIPIPLKNPQECKHVLYADKGENTAHEFPDLDVDLIMIDERRLQIYRAYLLYLQPISVYNVPSSVFFFELFLISIQASGKSGSGNRSKILISES